jgi:hypothetical protein
MENWEPIVTGRERVRILARNMRVSPVTMIMNTVARPWCRASPQKQFWGSPICGGGKAGSAPDYLPYFRVDFVVVSSHSYRRPQTSSRGRGHRHSRLPRRPWRPAFQQKEISGSPVCGGKAGPAPWKVFHCGLRLKLSLGKYSSVEQILIEPMQATLNE